MKGKRVSWSLYLVLVIISVLLSSLTEAVQTYNVQLQPAWFGNLNEHDVGDSTCAPTAAINAFVFLQNAYPSIYGGTLVPDTNGSGAIDYSDMVAAAQALGGPSFMKTSSPGGTNINYVLPGIQSWIEGKQPGVTFYQEQLVNPPNWAFLYEVLEAGSAVLLWLTYYDADGNGFASHVVTLTGLQFTDQNGDGILNAGETAKMTDVNPFNGTLVESDLFLNAGGVLWTNQAVGVIINGKEVASTRIHGAFVVRPIEQLGPVPITIDIKPGSDSNCFNQNERGVIPVAILGSADLDVTQINIESLALQGLSVRMAGKTNKYLAHYDYVNGDNYLDLIIQFQDSDGWIASGNGYATLTGELSNGTPIEGKDLICIVP